MATTVAVTPGDKLTSRGLDARASPGDGVAEQAAITTTATISNAAITPREGRYS
jgi:hypothetical protein